MHAVQEYQKNIVPQYVDALLKCPDKKVCSNLSQTLSQKYDSFYKNFTISINKDDIPVRPLENIAQRELNQHETYLIYDDTHLTKLYAREIEGLDVGFDGSLGRATLGLKIVTSLLTDRCVNIPIEAVHYIGKDLAQKTYRTKTDIAIDVTKHLIKHFKIKRMLADAHFSTNPMIDFLNTEQINYLMKVSRSRVVTIDGISGQLKNILRLKKNNHVKCAKGILNGIDCYFYVIKLKNGLTVYFISNHQIDPYEVVNLYRIRWNIELFHRTAKQYLGLGDCQMRSIEKQRQHIVYVMQAYALASVQRALMNLDCVEDYINHLRDVKPINRLSGVISTEGNFRYVA